MILNLNFYRNEYTNVTTIQNAKNTMEETVHGSVIG